MVPAIRQPSTTALHLPKALPAIRPDLPSAAREPAHITVELVLLLSRLPPVLPSPGPAKEAQELLRPLALPTLPARALTIRLARAMT